MDVRLESTFSAVGGKRLSAVECIGEGSSNQHEFNGVTALRSFLGESRRHIPARFLRLIDTEAGPPAVDEAEGRLTWYDAREKQPHRTPEFRLVYSADVDELMTDVRQGDLVWVAMSSDQQSAKVILAEAGTRSGRALDRLFQTDLHGSSHKNAFELSPMSGAGELDLEETDVLELLGVPVEADVDLLDLFAERFGGDYPMPPVAEFAAFSREIAGLAADPTTDPDSVLVHWWRTSEEAFYLYERHVLQPILDEEMTGNGGVDVDRFFELAARFKNSRFSRAGKTFENHLGALFDLSDIHWESPSHKLSDGSKPDFLMPSVRAYLDKSYPQRLLVFLGAKTSVKERWRQLADEAKRLQTKHLITLDRYLTTSTLHDMLLARVVPVMPAAIQYEHYAGRYPEVLTVEEFMRVVRSKQVEAEELGIL